MAQSEVIIRLMKHGEEDAVNGLVEDVFTEFIAPLYSEEGIKEFRRYIAPVRLAKRSATNHLILVAESGTRLVGIIEVRDYEHISLLFVTRDYQSQGIARDLLDEAVRNCMHGNENVSEISVHSSPNAVDAYMHLGFEVVEGEKVESGIRYIPMKLRISI
jgi:GNAT superfamily N-acetyltransferase